MRRILSFSRRFSSAMRRAMSGSDSARAGSKAAILGFYQSPSPRAMRRAKTAGRPMLPVLAMLPLGFASAAQQQAGPAPAGMPYPASDTTVTIDFDGPPR